MEPVNLLDDEGRTRRVRIPVMDLEELITPTEFHYAAQRFDIPEVAPADQWTLTIDGVVRNPAQENGDCCPSSDSPALHVAIPTLAPLSPVA